MHEDRMKRINEGNDVNKELGIEVVLLSPEKVVLQVEVGPKVHQPYGILHGGCPRSWPRAPRRSAAR